MQKVLAEQGNAGATSTDATVSYKSFISDQFKKNPDLRASDLCSLRGLLVHDYETAS